MIARTAVLVVATIVALACPESAAAQPPRGADTLSAAAVAESLQVAARLKSRLFFRPADTSSWRRLGLLGWALLERARVPDARVPGLDPTRVGRMADTALRIAADLAPSRIQYRLDVGHFLLGADAPITRIAANGHFARAVTAARATGDSALIAHAALEYGRTHWRRYDVLANRHAFIHDYDAPRSVSDAINPLAKAAGALELLAQLQLATDLLASAQGDPANEEMLKALRSGDFSPDLLERALVGTGGNAGAEYLALPRKTFRDVREYLLGNTYPLTAEVAGAGDFERAHNLFIEAYRADPASPGAFRAVAMVYAERAMWTALERVALEHVRRLPADSMGWLALGLAAHRRENNVLARAAFDSALARVNPDDRRRLDAWERVLPPNAVARRLRRASDSTADALASAYWLLATPYWADESRETRTEFLARVAYAEIRWSVERDGWSGVNSDRGDIHVRYGPPSRVIVIGTGSTWTNEITTFWLYDVGLVFAFRGSPTYLTARIPAADVAMVEELKELQPVRWDNLGAPATDTIPATVTRFRAGRDSVDVVVAARLPAPDSIRRSMAVVGAVERHFWLLGAQANPSADSAPLDSAGTYVWHRRVAPSSLLYRLEALGATAQRGARATGVVDANTTAFPLTGFGVSDLLTGVGASPAPGAAGWRELGVAPSAGVVQRQGVLAVAWEIYELANRDGATAYDVDVSLTSRRGRFESAAVRLLGALADIARRDASEERVSFNFSRSGPATPVTADHILIGLAGTPAGTYTLTLKVTDRVSGLAVERTTTVQVRE